MGVKMTKEGLRNLIKEVIKEETDYQKFFNSALSLRNLRALFRKAASS